MAKRKTNGKTSPAQWVIGILVLIIFVVSLVIGANRLMEWNRLRHEAEEKQEQKDAMTGAELPAPEKAEISA